jgi:NADH:ubiquinone oxidoreductase subunit E
VPAAAPTDLIELLHRLQRREGWLRPPALLELARQLGLPASHVQGVASFYHLFALQPPPAHRLGVCMGTACWVRGAEPLLHAAAAWLQSPEGQGWRLEPLGCGGACAMAPLLLCDGRVVR